MKKISVDYKLRFCLPRIKRSRIIDSFKSENPLLVIYESIEKEDSNEEEVNELINKLVSLILETDSFKLYADCDLGQDEENLRNFVKYVISALIRDIELRDHFSKIDSCEDYEKRQISALIEIKKPLNRNVWE